MKSIGKSTTICGQTKTLGTLGANHSLPVCLSPVNSYSSFVSQLSAPSSEKASVKPHCIPLLQGLRAQMLSWILISRLECNIIHQWNYFINVYLPLSMVNAIKAENKFGFVHHCISSAQCRMLSHHFCLINICRTNKLHKKYFSQRILFFKNNFHFNYPF